MCVCVCVCVCVLPEYETSLIIFIIEGFRTIFFIFTGYMR